MDEEQAQVSSSALKRRLSWEKVKAGSIVACNQVNSVGYDWVVKRSEDVEIITDMLDQLQPAFTSLSAILTIMSSETEL